MATHIADKQAEERVATATEYGLDVEQLDDQLSAYLRAADKHRLLTTAEEVALSIVIQAGIAAAKELQRIAATAAIVDAQTRRIVFPDVGVQPESASQVQSKGSGRRAQWGEIAEDKPTKKDDDPRQLTLF